tara:strand:- start:250904 stop:251281 length:378 start_codon:yes stop_codon:yes gene_type:complete
VLAYSATLILKSKIMKQNLSVKTLVQDMTSAFLGEVKEGVPAAKKHVQIELQKIASCIANIEALAAKGKITKQQAKLDLQIAEDAAQSTLIAATGISEITVAKGLKAAMGVVTGLVNTALGWRLI